MIPSRPLVLASILLCWLPNIAQTAQDPDETSKLQSRVQELAKQLDADKEVERDAAEKQLQEIGLQALDFLPILDDQSSPELRMRIERIREKFIQESTLDFHEPSLVNLVGEMSVSEALASIEKQTRNKIDLDNYVRQAAFSEIVHLDIQGVTYWEAIDELLEKVDWQVALRDGGKIAFAPKQKIQEDLPAAINRLPHNAISPIYIGVLRLQPAAISKTTSFLDPLQSSAQLDFVLHWEPRFNPVFVRFPMDKLVVRTDNDEALLVPRDQSCEYTPIGSQLMSTMRVLKPTQKAIKIASWKGELQIAIPGRIATIDFQDAKENSGKSLIAGDLTVVLESARKNRDLHEIQIGVSLANQPNNEVLQGWVGLTDGYLVDPDGNPIQHAGWATTRLTKNDIGISYLFDIQDDLTNYRFVYRAPESIILQTVDYEFNNIPLP